MTLQETFDKVVAHLAQQKRPATPKEQPLAHGANNMYRTPEGLACAVGCLLPDDIAKACDTHPSGVYDISTMWEYDVPGLRECLRIDGMSDDSAVEFYNEIQRAHDIHTTPEGIRRRLHKVAVLWHLDGSKVETITEWQ